MASTSERVDAGSFVALAGRCGVDPTDARRLHADLVAHHTEPHRRYHTLEHVDAVLGHLDTTAAGLPDRRAVELAAWYHDVVYDPARMDNEAASAALARAELEAAGADPDVVTEVVRLVEVTASHRAGAPDEAALCDADLAVLGAEPSGYAAYLAAVRAEYGFLDDDQWRAGRPAVLRSLLALDAIYACPAFTEREARARHNLGAELDALERRPGGGPAAGAALPRTAP